MGLGLHKVRITVPDGISALTRIELDGQELRDVTLVDLHIERGLAMVTLELLADLDVEGELHVVKQSRTVSTSTTGGTVWPR